MGSNPTISAIEKACDQVDCRFFLMPFSKGKWSECAFVFSLRNFDLSLRPAASEVAAFRQSQTRFHRLRRGDLGLVIQLSVLGRMAEETLA